jgi:hypothetical protein
LEKCVAPIWGHPAAASAERKLGKLVHFERREPARPSGKADRSTKAEILIFTGVRYERGTPDVPSKPTPSRGVKRKRG